MGGYSTLWKVIVDCIVLHYMHIWHLRIRASNLQFRASKINMALAQMDKLVKKLMSNPVAHLTQRVMWAIVTTERHSSVRPLTFHILINSSEATGPIWTKLWWNGPWMAPFQICVRWSRLPTKMAAKLKIEKRGDEIVIVHCCFSISQNELKF